MSDSVRIGLVGAGAIAQAYLAAAEHCPRARFVGVCDLRRAAALAAAERAGCSDYETYQDLAEDSGCDAVIVCTPPASHPEIALHFLNRSVPVLCEKPLSIELAGARAMAQAAARHGVTLAMASKFRYVEDVIETKSIIESGGIGDILLIENTFAAPVNMAGRWNADPRISGGGVLIDNGTHSVDIVRYLLGPIVDVLAVTGRNLQKLPVEDSASLHLRTASHADGFVDLSWSVHKEQSSFVRVYGSAGTIEIGWKQSRYRRDSTPGWIEFGHGYDKNAAFLRKLVNFCDSVLGTAKPLISTEEALASVEVIQAAYASLNSGTWTAVHSPPAGVRVVEGR